MSIVTATRPNALVVPSDAILTLEPGVEPVVVVIDDDGRIHRRSVRVGLQSETLSEIAAGLEEGQVAATSRLTDLHDGDVVSAQINDGDNRTALNRSL